MLYWPLRAYARRLLNTLPADPDGILDAVATVVAALLAVHDD